MWNTFRYTVLAIIQEREVVFWAMLFPIILSTLFSVMFSGIDDEAGRLDPIPVAIVGGTEGGAESGSAAEAFDAMIDELADRGEGGGEDESEGGADGDETGSENGDSEPATTTALISPIRTSTYESAFDLLRSGEAVGIITLDGEGWPHLEMSPAAGDFGVSMSGVERTILADIMDNYVRSRTVAEHIAQADPRALANAAVIESLTDRSDYTKQITVTHSRTRESVRYFYALLGFAALMAAQVGLAAIGRTLPNTSPLGARRAIGGLSRTRTLAATLLASWMISFIALVVAFAYIRFALGIDFGDRDGACVGGLAIASLMSTALGTLIGALPGIPDSAKGGLLTGLTCFASLFAGLYGTPAMSLADQVALDFPWAAAVNPAKLVCDLFYSLYVYPDFGPFLQTGGALLAMSAVFACAAALLMRRQSYARL